MSINFRMQSFGIDSVAQRHRNKFFKNWDILTNFLEENRQHIFYIFVYYVITIGKLSNIYHSTHIRSIYIKSHENSLTTNTFWSILQHFLWKDLCFTHSCLNTLTWDMWWELESQLQEDLQLLCRSAIVYSFSLCAETW